MLQIIRFPNLLIVATTQYLLQYLVLLPALNQAGISPILSHIPFFFLVLTTVLLATGGYLINDIIDYKTDLINKPDKVVINYIMPKRTVLIIYWCISIIGAIIAWCLAEHVKKQLLFFIYPTAMVLLYFYSKHFKKTPLTGNIIVAFFCAGVAGMVLFAERFAYIRLFETRPSLAFKITAIFSGYILFAFISTLLREIIKDIEDIEGDKKSGLKTFPIVFGIEKAKKISIIIASTMIAGVAFSAYWLFGEKEWIAILFTFIGIIFPLIFVIWFLKKSSVKTHFSILSRLTKFIMLAGLILLILIWKF